jgi:hypothetical protein
VQRGGEGRYVTKRAEADRNSVFGQSSAVSPIDNLRAWFFVRRVRRETGRFEGLRAGDIGCEFES